jgi:serine O-acetyltransferase
LGRLVKYDRRNVKAWAGDSQWRALRADFARFRQHGYNGWVSEGFWPVVIYRLQRVTENARPRWLWAPTRTVLALVRKLVALVTHIHIDRAAKIGPGLLIPHCGPINVHRDTKIGADCSLFQGCTIGAGHIPGGAIIGDHVHIACHSSIIGPVKIGDEAMIAPNSLVITDVPAGTTAIGVPARILPGKWRARDRASVPAVL